MRTTLSGWTPDTDARALPTPKRAIGPSPVSPTLFFSTLGVRRRLERGPATAEAIAQALYVLTTVAFEDAEATVRAQLDELRRCGIVVTELRGSGEGRRSEHSLTGLGMASLGWRSPPVDPRVDVRRWAGEVARAVSTAHRVNHHAMLRAAFAGPEVLRARGRLCDALEADLGWSFVVIERHFGMRAGMAQPAAEAWRRGRDYLDAAEKRMRRIVDSLAAHTAHVDQIHRDALKAPKLAGTKPHVEEVRG